MTTFNADHQDQIELNIPAPEAGDRYQAIDLAARAVADEPVGHKAAEILGLEQARADLDVAGPSALANNVGPLLEQARAALKAGEIGTVEFIERVAPLLERIDPAPAEVPAPEPPPGLVALGRSLAPIVRAGSGLGVVGLGLGVVALAGGAFALGVMARSATTR